MIGQETEVKPVVPAMRVLLYAASALVLPIVLLFVLPDRTDTLAAWPIKPPLSAAFLGGGYLAAFFLAFLSAREKVWARARLAFASIFLISVLLLIATLLHLDRFHFSHPNGFTRFLAWLWLVAYAVFPMLMPLALVLQRRRPGGDPGLVAPLQRWARALLSAQGGLAVLVGAVMFVAPATAMGFWPWELTPLTSQAIGAWAVSMGALALNAAWEHDWTRLRAMVTGYGLFGIVQLVNLTRFTASVDWTRPSAWAYAAFVASVAAMGAFGWLQTRRAARRQTGVQTA